MDGAHLSPPQENPLLFTFSECQRKLFSLNNFNPIHLNLSHGQQGERSTSVWFIARDGQQGERSRSVWFVAGDGQQGERSRLLWFTAGDERRNSK